MNSRTTIRLNDEKKRLLNRISRIEGQVRGVYKMLENDAYCNDILIQTTAINSAINAFNKELLKRHVECCITNDLKRGNMEVIDELVNTLSKMMK